MFRLSVNSSLSYMVVAVSVYIRNYLMSLYVSRYIFYNFCQKKKQFWSRVSEEECGFTKR